MNNKNKLIAEFMGAVGTPKYNPTEWDVYITGCLDVDSDDENAQHFYTPDEMKYHTSWDWLMPVHRKCMFTPNFSGDDQLRTLLIDAVIDADINRLYNAVVEFINQYNNE